MEYRTEVFIDRATHKFGIIYYDSHSIAAVEQFPDTDEPVYFGAKTARAACKQVKCYKITVLFQHLQLDLKFDSSGSLDTNDHVTEAIHAHDFVSALEALAVAAQNKSFCIHTIIAQGFSHVNFDMASRGHTERTVQPWMTAPTGSSNWSR